MMVQVQWWATHDGNYLYAYGYSTYTYPFNEYWKARLNIIKFAPNGNIISNRFYDSIRMVLNVGKIKVCLIMILS